MAYSLELKTSLTEIDPEQWNQLGEADYPFTRHEFLLALEQQHCLLEFGWQPVYFTLTEPDMLVAALPAFIKTNSYGELVFDHSWANAYERSGRNYFPKLVTAIPYTPATGPRFLIHGDIDSTEHAALIRTLVKVVMEFCQQNELSGWHLLFEREAVAKELSDLHLIYRYDCQYHWFNKGYTNFDDFLSALSSRKRKNIRKERQRVSQQKLSIERKYGHELSEKEWLKVHQLYADIFRRKYGTATLTADFMLAVGQQMKQRVMVVLARHQSSIVAASLFFISDSTLFGRVWGCDEYFDFLHFECCYYQGIDYCIEHGLQIFDPGAQGEHKISRGFLPTRTCSAHWLADQQFHQLVQKHTQQETRYIEQYCDELMTRSPYRKTP